MIRLLDSHIPQRPQWTCRRCGLPYPCPPSRDRLVTVYGLTPQLGRHTYSLLETAVRDRSDLSVAELYDRFVAWTLPPQGIRPSPLGEDVTEHS